MTKELTPIEQKVQADYNKIAPAFSQSRQELRWPELDQMIAEVPEGSKVLDIGCGTGRLCGFFQKEKQIDYTGIDISEEELALAKKDCPTGMFLNASMQELPFDDQSFDVIFMIASLHHLITDEERTKALQEASRVLKPGGTCYITVMNLWRKRYRKLFWSTRKHKKEVGKEVADNLKWNDVLWRWTWNVEEPVYRYYHAFTRGEMKRLLKNTGWQIEKNQYMSGGKKASAASGKNLVTVVKKVV